MNESSTTSLRLNLLSATREVVRDLPVRSVTLPTDEGRAQILPQHINYLGILRTGEFEFTREDGEQRSGVISFGFVEVRDGIIKVLAETLEFVEEIDIERAKEAERLAEESLTQTSIDDAEFWKYERKRERARIRVQAANAKARQK